MTKRAAKAKEEPKPVGRPTLYTPELFASICEELGKGEPLAVICRTEGYPDPDTVRNWGKADEEVGRLYGLARAAGYHAIASRLRRTARGKTLEEGGDSTGDVQRDKLIIETDLKLLAKWDPKGYGDKVALVGGGPDDSPIQISETDAAAKIAAILAGARARSQGE